MKAYQNIFMLSINLTCSQCISISGIYHVHREPKAELLPLDTELERNLKKLRFAEAVVMAGQREIQ